MNNTTKPKCPWPMPFMRDQVKQSLAKVGGQVGFDFLGRGMQDALVDQMCFSLVSGVIRQGGTVSAQDLFAMRETILGIVGLD